MKKIEFPEDVKKLKKFLKNNYKILLTDEEIQSLWEEYSDIFAAGWLTLPEKIDNLKSNQIFQNILEKYLPKYLVIKSESGITKELYLIDKKELNNLTKELLLKVPEIEKNYYETQFNKQIFDKQIFEVIYYEEKIQKKIIIINEKFVKTTKVIL